MRFVLFCPSGIVPAQFAALSTGSVGNVTCIRTEEELRNKLRHRPQSVVISAGRPAECAEMWFRFYRDHSFVVVLCVAPFFLPPDVSISGVLKNLRLLKPGMSVEHQYCKCLWWVFRAETCRNFASYGQLLCLYERGE